MEADRLCVGALRSFREAAKAEGWAFDGVSDRELMLGIKKVVAEFADQGRAGGILIAGIEKIGRQWILLATGTCIPTEAE